MENKGMTVTVVGVIGSIVTASVTAAFTNWDKIAGHVSAPPELSPTSLSSPVSAPSTVTLSNLSGSWMPENPKEDEKPWRIRKNGDGIQLQSGSPTELHPESWYTYDPVPNQPNTYQRYKDQERTKLLTIIAKTDNSFTRIAPDGTKRTFYRR